MNSTYSFHSVLKAKHREERYKEVFTQNLILRLHRSLSWFERLEHHLNNDEFDEAMVFGWIAFSSLYITPNRTAERKRWEDYFCSVHGKNRNLFEKLFVEQGYIAKDLVEDETLHTSFWDGEDIQYSDEMQRERFYGSKEKGQYHLSCSVACHRIYVLRNQIMHGFATYKSANNRVQIEKSAIFLHGLIKILLEDVFVNPLGHDREVVNYVEF